MTSGGQLRRSESGTVAVAAAAAAGRNDQPAEWLGHGVWMLLLPLQRGRWCEAMAK